MSGSKSPKGLWKQAVAGLNWFRIHLLVFTIVPFVFSGFFMAANPSSTSGLFVTEYIDALFMCFSAMSETGLNTVSVSELRPAQQAFLFILMLIGDISIVNLVTVCHRVVESTILPDLHTRHKNSSDYSDAEEGEHEAGITGVQGRKDDGADKKNEEDQPAQPSKKGSNKQGPPKEEKPSHDKDEENRWGEGFRRRHDLRVKSGHSSRPNHSPRDPHASIPHASSGRRAHSGRGGFPDIFDIAIRLVPASLASRIRPLLQRPSDEGLFSSHPIQGLRKALKQGSEDYKDAGEKKNAQSAKWLPPGVRSVVVGRNSQFFEEELNDEDLELLGSLEYRATKVLTFLVIGHILFWTLIPITIIAVYLARVPYWDSNFIANGATQSGTVNETWFTIFQVVSAYSSCGLSLVDTLMVPFQHTFLLIYVLLFPMLAGNQALPLFLRIEVWLLTKVVRKGSEFDVSLHFILTHSRRYVGVHLWDSDLGPRFFLYFFPAHQSWLLFGVESLITSFGILGFVAFDHGLPYYASVGSGWDKFSVGFFQSFSARATGFGIVSISSIAPALVVLYLMYIFTCNYPLVMAIRSTNVYEERALGLHGEHAPGQHNQKTEKDGGGGEIFSKYLKQHLLPQIFFDLWPILVGTLFICVVERGQLFNPNNVGWLGIFQILFEATSGYGTVGLSYGNPYNTSSLSASFRKISKLIMILLMLRGRHRGLPLAIDRASMFPVEYLRLDGGAREKVEEDRVAQAGEEAAQG
ncbi:Trk/Ktr/HKT type cation transporter, partial [Tremellales sp. Uapishka_1]